METCRAFGKTWNHRQFHGLVQKLIDEGKIVRFAPPLPGGIYVDRLTKRNK